MEVRGQIVCGYRAYLRREPVVVQISFVERNEYHLMNETKVKDYGFFKIFGELEHVVPTQFALTFKHTCVDGKYNPKCNVTSSLILAKQLLGTMVEIGVINLNLLIDNRKINCKN
ncbi:unnamed protein product [Dracunculus medinensis]|uniref:Transthyretin-like family protein n=1 Tax=Dracunculus medinensis TaxID=318479 RepID=A0A0N4UA57_DRAME|nr:unnamed protein product [Dracunculus medinensis]